MSRIVHYYFLRFRLILREIQHFVFRIGLYKTACSAISLRVAAKTRTKPTYPPSTVERTNMTLTVASCRCDIFVISSRYKPIHSCHGRYADRLIWCLSLCRSNQTLELYRDQYWDTTRHLGGNGAKGNRRLQLIRADWRVINTLITSLYAKYADIFEKLTAKLLSWRIYILIDFMLTTPLLSRTTGKPKRHLKKWRVMIAFGKQTLKLA